MNDLKRAICTVRGEHPWFYWVPEEGRRVSTERKIINYMSFYHIERNTQWRQLVDTLAAKQNKKALMIGFSTVATCLLCYMAYKVWYNKEKDDDADDHEQEEYKEDVVSIPTPV